MGFEAAGIVVELGSRVKNLRVGDKITTLVSARNIHDTLSSENIEQLIRRNQCLIGFNLPTVDRRQIAENVPELLRLIAQGKLKLFADSAFPLGEVKKAFEALSSRNTIGKVALIPSAQAARYSPVPAHEGRSTVFS